jgi:hypothetical protein
VLVVALVAIFTFSSGAAWADGPGSEAEPPLLKEGAMDFPAIRSASDPEEFSWTVQLGEEQRLRQIDEHEVAAYWQDGSGVEHLALDFIAKPAHDAEGARVPTTLDLVGRKVITLTVHHREGNPAAGGAPFDYPIISGEGWEGGLQTIVVPMSPPEASSHSDGTSEEAPSPPVASPVACRVPGLHGATLDEARNRLHRAHCRLGAIAKGPDVTASAGRVVGQGAAPGSSLAAWGKVNVRLGPPASPARR